MSKIDWVTIKCRFGCDSPVAGLYHAPEGCWCFPDKIQALCAQHAVKGMQNNDMSILVARVSDQDRADAHRDFHNNEG